MPCGQGAYSPIEKIKAQNEITDSCGQILNYLTHIQGLYMALKTLSLTYPKANPIACCTKDHSTCSLHFFSPIWVPSKLSCLFAF